MAAYIEFTSSDTFLESDPRAAEAATVTADEYVEGTYDMLRTGPDGREIARLIDDAWQLADGRRFSDWAVRIAA